MPTCWLAVINKFFLVFAPLLVALTGWPSSAAEVLPRPVEYDLSQERISEAVLWQAPMWVGKTVNLTSFNYNTMITSFRGNTYMVYVDEDRRPRVVKIDSKGKVQSVYLDDSVQQHAHGEDVYRSLNDGHHTFSIGVDEKGFLHVSGDMHGYPSKGAVSHLPDRYNPLKNKGYCMYWRSDKPEDVGSFTWLGDDKAKSPQGEYFSYMAFVNDANGRLTYYSRQRRNGHRQMLWVASVYNADLGTWSFIGGTDGTPYKVPLTIWENGGENANHYVRSQGWVYHDRNDRMHLLTTVITGRPEGTKPGGHWVTDCVYIASDDRGKTATKADGTPVIWPARAKAGPNQGDVVHSKHFMSTPVSLAVDLQQHPVVMLKASGKNFLNTWDAKTKKWQAHAPLDGGKVFNDPQGVLTVLAQNHIKRGWKAAGPFEVHRLNHRVHLVDRQYLRRTGNFRGLARKGNDLALIEIKIERPVNYLPLRLNALAVTIAKGETRTIKVQSQFKIDEPLEVEVEPIGEGMGLRVVSPRVLHFDVSSWNQDQAIRIQSDESFSPIDDPKILRLKSRLGDVEVMIQAGDDEAR